MKKEEFVVEKVELKTLEEAKATPMEIPDEASLEVGNDRSRQTLAPSPERGGYDPFEKFKTNPEKYYYYAVNNKPLMRDERTRQGFELIPEATCGDLVLARMPIERHKDMVKREQDKAKKQLRAPKQAYKEEMEQMGAGDLIEE